MATGTNTQHTTTGDGDSRSRARTWLARGMVVPLVAVVVGVGVSAEAAPEQVLQAVEVELGSDGTITTIESDAVRKAEGSKASTDQASFDPSKSAGELPVRVLTSYRLGDQVGTDLDDIEGESGRVVIDVTVQNTTVRPELLSFDSAGVQKQQYALVGTPLTVIASAGLGKDSIGEVVTGEDGSALTNGVLSRSSDGSSQVQWAAMLAPPRLAPSATFTLVQDTEDFQVPDIDVSVQPGLVTDTSVQNLLRSAFAEDEGSTLRMETATIGLIGEVNTTLTGAATVLSDIQESLSTTAGELGQRTISDLQASTSALTGSLQGVAGDITSLESEISGTLDGTSSKLLTQLQSTLDRVKGLLGDPANAKGPEKVTQTERCAVQLPGYEKGAQLSVYQHILQVQARLDALKTASGNCGAVIESRLARQLGDKTATCTDANADSAICVLGEARGGLQDEITRIESLKADLQAYDEGLGEFGTKAWHLRRIAGYVHDKATEIAPEDDTTIIDEEVQALTELDNALAEVEGLLPAVEDGLTALAGIRDRAIAQDDLLAALVEPVVAGDGSTTPSGTDRLRDLLASCTLPKDVTVPEPPTTPEQTYIKAVQDACAAGRTSGESIADALETTRQAWGQTETEAGTAAAAADLATFSEQLATVRGRLDDAREDLSARDADGNPTGIAAELVALREEVQGLFLPPGYDCTTTPRPTQWVNQVWCLAVDLGLDPEGGEVPPDISERLQELQDRLGSMGGDLGTTAEGVDAARSDAVTDVERLTKALGDQMSGAGDDLQVEGQKSLSESNEQLDKQYDVFGTRLGGSVEKVIGEIAGTVTSANRSLGDTEKRLAADLQAVLVDLGNPERGSSGLLGALRTNAGQTALSTRQVTAANNRAVSFGNVRSEALNDIYLQQEQLTRSLEMQQEFPAFGLEVPGGSEVLTVFTFHLEGN